MLGRSLHGAKSIAKSSPVASCRLVTRLLRTGRMDNGELLGHDPPKTSRQLLLTLSHASRAHPPLPLAQLLEQHSTYPELRSPATYNLLLDVARKRRHYAQFDLILGSMDREGVQRDVQTWKSTVSVSIQREGWEKTWSDALVSMNRNPRGAEYERPGAILEVLPLGVWLEFVKSVTHSHLHRRALGGGYELAKWHVAKGRAEREEAGEKSGPSFESISKPTVEQARKRMELLILEHPSLSQDMTSSEMFLVVNALLHTDFHELALKLTRMHLARLSTNPSFLDLEISLNMIHMHLVFGFPRMETSSILTTLEDLLVVHPGIIPGPRTLFMTLKRVYGKKRGRRAQEIVDTFKEKWGDDIEDSKVRRLLITVASRAGIEGDWETVERVLARETQSRPPVADETNLKPVRLGQNRPENARERQTFRELLARLPAMKERSASYAALRECGPDKTEPTPVTTEKGPSDEKKRRHTHLRQPDGRRALPKNNVDSGLNS